MKKIIYTFVLLVTCCLGSKAQGNYDVQGPSAYFTNNWGDDTKDRMSYSEKGGTRRYYLVKQFIIASDDTTIPFRVHRHPTNSGYSAGYITYNGYQSSATSTTGATMLTENATLHFVEAGTYKVMFTIDLNNDNSLEAVILEADITDDTNNVPPLWTERSMTFDETDNKFHYSQDVANVTVGTTASFTALVYHRTTDPSTPVSYGATGAGDTNPVSISFTEAGSYQLDFTVDPLWRTAPEVTVRGYYDFLMQTPGYATFSYHKVVDVPEGLAAHFITGQNSSGFFATATKQIPKTTTTPEQHTGVILSGAPGGTFRLYWSADQSAAIPNQGSNLLYGTGSATHTVSAGDTYVFAEKSGAVGFYLGKAGTYAANKAYLNASDVSGGSSPVREYLGISFGETTDIENVRNGLPANNQYYNLQGQPVSHPTKGIYILNGKKVLKR